MTFMLRETLAGLITPLFRRPRRLQVAALCYRKAKSGHEVLLITSSRGRWILPKGWPIEGLDAEGTALQEAWEEAGVKSVRGTPQVCGEYDYTKRFDEGHEAPCRVKVFAAEVKELADEFPDSALRKRKWVPIRKAATMVNEPGLQDILNRF